VEVEPKQFAWLEPEPKNFRWWSRRLKFGYPFNRHSLLGKGVLQIIQCLFCF